MTTEPNDPPADAALVAQVVDGSEAALASLYDRHAAAIYGLAVRLSNDRGIAEEVVQETFLVLWNRAELFDPAVGSLPAWMRTIARNRTVDRLRAIGRRPLTLPLSAAGGPNDEAPEPLLDRLASEGLIVGGGTAAASPELATERAELRATVAAVLAEMPELERIVIELAYRDELTQAEIAERLRWPLGTVKTRTRRALLRMRDLLADDDPTHRVTD